MASDKHAGPMRNAEASLRMEGLIVTPQMRERCVEVLEGRAMSARNPSATAESHTIMDGRVHVYRRPNSRFWQCSVFLGTSGFPPAD